MTGEGYYTHTKYAFLPSLFFTIEGQFCINREWLLASVHNRQDNRVLGSNVRDLRDDDSVLTWVLISSLFPVLIQTDLDDSI